MDFFLSFAVDMTHLREDAIHPPVVERIRIAVRERPVSDEDLASIQVRLKTDEDKLVAFAPGAPSGAMYDYDYYYPQNARQEDVFRTIGLEMVEIIMGGLSTSCVTLGLADTGKTHTLFGSANESGLIQDTARELFRRLEAQNEHTYEVTLKYWDMSHESAVDNLSEDVVYRDDEAIPVHHTIFRDDFDRLYLRHLNEVEVANFDEFERLLNEGNQRRINRAYERQCRWHGFVQLAVLTTDVVRGERCVLRTMTFVHTKGPDRVGSKGFSGATFPEYCNINVSVTLLCAGVLHSLEYRERRKHLVKTKEDLFTLIQKSQSFFMECHFSKLMAQYVCGHEASFIVGCVNPLNYRESIDMLENLQLFCRLRCSCFPIVMPSDKGRLLKKLRALERAYGDEEMLAKLYCNESGRPFTEEEEQLRRLKGAIEGWNLTDDEKVRQHEEEMKQRGRERNAADAGGHFQTHGDRNKIYLNPAKTATYEGQWADGVFDGFGEHIQSNFKYRGEFRRGLREGDGALFIRDSKTSSYVRVYQGEWLAGKRDGRGTQWCKNGEVYEGDFVADKRHGVGKLYLVNGDIISGNFRDNLTEGWAVLRTPSGDWFEGFWCRGMREGPGVWHYVERKQCLEGEWSKNIAVMGVLTDDKDKNDNSTGHYIPRIGLLNYEQIFEKEREKLNERREKEFASEGRVWTDQQITFCRPADTKNPTWEEDY